MTTSRENTVVLDGTGLMTVSYLDNSLVVTEGQPASPPPHISQLGNPWTITMNCGRAGSGAVAGEFLNVCGGAGHVFSPKAKSDSTPKDLNFYFGLSLWFESNGGTELDLYLAQGHRDGRNNWWIGGKHLAKHKSEAVLAMFYRSQMAPKPEMIGQLQQVFTITGGFSNFLFSPRLPFR